MALFVVFKSFMSCCLTFSLFHWVVWMSRASVHNVSVLCFVCLLCLQNSSSTSGWVIVSLLESVPVTMSATAETSANYENSHNAASFLDAEQIFDMVVAGSHPKHIH